MDNYMDMDDDDSEEIIAEDDIDYETALYFNDPFAQASSSDESSAQNGDATAASSQATAEPSSQPTDPASSVDSETLKKLNEFSLEKFSQELFAVAGTGDLQTCLHKHWKTYVPLCFSVSDNPTNNLADTNSIGILIKPLENYICANLDSEKLLKSLNELDDPPQLCGKVFKNGEPSYFCRDCGSDPTCVLCSNCFRRSKHRDHKYKMMTSAGGGYCDCGDTEAWKSDPYCELHKPKSSSDGASTSNDSFESKLPADIRQRATELFGYLLVYIFEMLSDENSEELPSHLKPDSPADDYVTMLYNDEVHSYEQVVNTLRKVLTIDDKKAFDFAAIVDKEGRSAIKRSKKNECAAAKSKVETTMTGPQSPLKTRVMHHSLVSHQYFAERAIAWLMKVCEYSKGLKQILCKIGLFTKPDSHSLVEKLMLADNVFWKSARAAVHQYFISIYFMDPNWKKDFAGLYAKNYKLIWRNFIRNPDETVSLTDLAVQMFTVISLSKHLISNYNLLETIMETLIEHSKTSKGKLSFPRTRQRYSNMEFRRAQFILFDFKYCLTSAPVNEWTDDLRKNFINGFKAFVEFIKFMHGMDGIERYTQQHIEFEPEWETSFNLLIKLQKSIIALIEWCSTDKQVYFECYKYLLNAIHQAEVNDAMFTYTYDKRKFNGQQYEIINFPVIKKEVSIHAPLTRLFAGLYAQMNLFACNFVTIVNQLQASSLNPLSSLKHDLPQQKMINLVEPSLRALVLVSQTNAGLWKRNGFSLLSQVYFYSNIKCRHEMFDRDILCLQMGASVMDPNEFLICASERYNLFEYFSEDNFETPTDNPPDYYKTEYLLPVAEDFLELLIHLVSERFEANLSEISTSQKLEREAIHQLCISPLPHSDLVKNIYSDNEKYTNELEAVLHKIAIFKNATSPNAKGTYELKEAFLSQYSPYFYHYIRSDKTKSEEYQLGLRKNEKEKFFKPPVLPRWTKLFEKISHLLDSDFFIRILFNILRRFSNKSKLLSEGQLARVLHLIGLALHEEQADIDSQSNPESPTYSFKFIEKSIINFKRPSSGLFSFKSSKTEESLIKYLNEIVANNSLPDQLKLLAAWNVEYAQRLLKIKNKSNYQQKSEDRDEKEAGKAGANESDEAAAASKEEEAARIESENIKRKNQIAEKRRAKVLAQFNQMQKNFIVKNKDLYEESSGSSEGAYSRLNSELGKLSSESSDMGRIVCIGPNQTCLPVMDASKTRYRCILCQEDQNISIEMPPMVLCCYIQSSRVLSKRRKQRIENFDKFDPLFMENSVYWGINTTSCGHVMHANCWQKYVDTVRLTENRRHARMFGFSVKRNEYLCPLCETIGNTVLPLFPDLKYLSRLSPQTSESSESSSISRSISDESQRKKIALSYDDWLDGLEKTLENSVKQELQDDKDVFIINPCPLSTITKLMADAVASNFKLLFEFDSFMPASIGNIVPKCTTSPTSSPTASASLTVAASSSSPVLSFLPSFFSNEIKLNSETVSIMENFTRISYTFGLTTFPDDTDPRMPMSIWSNCAFTIQVAEQVLRVEAKPLFGHLSLKQSDLLSNIVKQAAIYGIAQHSDSIRKSCVRLLSSILPYKTALYDSLDIMKIDLFHFLVSLCLSVPNLYDKPKITSVANGGINDAYIFQLALQAHCVQILISKLKFNAFASAESQEIKMMDEDDVTEPMSTGEQTTTSKNKEETIVFELFKNVIEQLKLKNNYQISEDSLKSQLEKATPQAVYRALKVSLMPFLRCSALFFSNLTDLVPSVTIANDTAEFVDNNFSELLHFLGVSNGIGSVLDLQSNSFKTLCNHWLSSPNNSPLTAVNLSADLIEYPMKVNEFIELPKDYIDLISLSMSSHVCSSSNKATSSFADNSSDPATILCLICGEMLCSQANCCQQEIGKKRVGSCTAHAYKCSGSVGVFLRVAECQVLMLHLNINSEDDLLVRGSFLPAPYLDDYGETDQGLRRGNPLRLCQARYQKLYKDWLSHSIPDEVSRSYQNNQNTLITVDWNQF